LDASFHNDPRIREWTNQIVEKIFTVCLLTGDSVVEFQKGCQLIIKLTAFLRETATLSSESLADEVKQSLKQRLPDARVINSFPEFQATMDRMLRVALKDLASYPKNTLEIIIEPHLEFVTPSVIPALTTVSIPYPNIQQTKNEVQAKADALSLNNALAKVDALTQAQKQAEADALKFSQALAQAEMQAKTDVLVLSNALAKAHAQAKADNLSLTDALAKVNALTQTQKQMKIDVLILADALSQADTLAKADNLALTDALAKVDALTQAQKQAKADALVLADELAKADAQSKADALSLAEVLAQFETVAELQLDALIEVPALVTSIHSKSSLVFLPSQESNQTNFLKRVLINIFPKATIYWNRNLMGQTFLAQVEDILISLHDPEHPCNMVKYNKDGWKVLVCSTEDLTFPRRLERGIRQIKRSVV